MLCAFYKYRMCVLLEKDALYFFKAQSLCWTFLHFYVPKGSLIRDARLEFSEYKYDCLLNCFEVNHEQSG